VVPAHSNQSEYGRGFSFKSHDWAVAALCRESHDYIDGRKGGWTKEEKHAEWLRAFVKTQTLLWERGLIRVA
jgi:hypothetical protein